MRCLQVKHFERTHAQSEAIGLSVPQDESHGAGQGGSEVSSKAPCPQVPKQAAYEAMLGAAVRLVAFEKPRIQAK